MPIAATTPPLIQYTVQRIKRIKRTCIKRNVLVVVELVLQPARQVGLQVVQDHVAVLHSPSLIK